MSYYTSTGTGGRRTSSTSSRTGTATANRQLAAAARAAEKADQARALHDALQAILNVHRAEFTPAQPSVAPPPPPVDIAAIRARYMKEARDGTSVFSRNARKSALAEAQRRADAEAAATVAHYERERASWQAALNEGWAKLSANDPDAVLGALAEAFEDNEAAAAPIGVEGAEVSLVVVVPAADTIPERRPTTTSAGTCL